MDKIPHRDSDVMEMLPQDSEDLAITSPSYDNLRSYNVCMMITTYRLVQYMRVGMINMLGTIPIPFTAEYRLPQNTVYRRIPLVEGHHLVVAGNLN